MSKRQVDNALVTFPCKAGGISPDSMRLRDVSDDTPDGTRALCFVCREEGSESWVWINERDVGHLIQKLIGWRDAPSS